MAVRKAIINFTNDFKGELITSKAKAPIGSEEGTLAPYDMLFGALASCLYATFLSVAEKKRITFESASIEVTGEKREEVPATLKWVNVKITVKDASKEKGLTQAADLATQYCSIYQTIGHVAEMSWEIDFL